MRETMTFDPKKGEFRGMRNAVSAVADGSDEKDKEDAHIVMACLTMVKAAQCKPPKGVNGPTRNR